MQGVHVIGFLGTLMILIAFIMNQKHKWRDDYLVYDLSNFIGSAFLVWYAYLIDAYPFMLLNSIWALISLSDIIKFARGTKKDVGGDHAMTSSIMK